MDHFNAAQDSRCAGGRVEAEHGPDPALDAPVILLDAVVKILTLADADRLQRSAGSILQPALTVAGFGATRRVKWYLSSDLQGSRVS